MNIVLDKVVLKFEERVILDGVSIEIQPGRVTGIMGPSGSGKTILMRLIGGQLQPTSGCVLVDGKDINRLSQKELYQTRMRMGMLFQTSALFRDLSVFENVAYPLREHSALPESLIRHIVLCKLQAVGLRGARDLMPADLSGGMQRRVAIARAVAFDPEAIIYDDPFSGLDPISIATIIRLIKTLNESLKSTSVIVSHDVEEVMEVTDYIYVISNGQVVDQGSPDEIQKSKSEWVGQFLSGSAEGPASFHYPRPPLKEEIL